MNTNEGFPEANRETTKFCEEFGGWLFKSELMKFPTEEAARIVAFEMLSRRMSFQQFDSKYQIVFGKLAMRHDAMLAAFNDRGGSHEVEKQSPEVAEITLSKGSRMRTFKVTHEELKGEIFYEKNPKYKRSYSRQQMLWARVVSLAVKTFDPGATGTAYTPQEAEDAAREDGEVTDKKPAVTVAAIAAAKGQSIESVQDVIATVMAGGQNAEAPAAAEGMASTELLMEMEMLVGKVYPGKRKAAIESLLERRGLKTLEQMSTQQVEEIIAKVKDKLAVKN